MKLTHSVWIVPLLPYVWSSGSRLPDAIAVPLYSSSVVWHYEIWISLVNYENLLFDLCGGGFGLPAMVYPRMG